MPDNSNGFLNTVQNLVEDMINLEVTTLSGDITLNVTPGTTLNELTQKIGDKMTVGTTASGNTENQNTVKVVAFTKKNSVDGDLIQTFQQNLSAQDQVYLECHKEALAAAIASRKSVVDSLLAFLKAQ